MTMSRNPLFGGRDSELKRLASALKAGRAAALVGADGAGKTALAAEFVHRSGRYFAGGVFWLSFGIPEEVSLQVAACGGSIGMNLRPDFAELALDDQLHLVLRTWQAETPRLLVFDECDDEDLLREWLPSIGGAHVLVTSRRPWDALRVETVTVGPLAREESMALLRRLRPDVPQAAPALRQLADELEDLPLALRIAGGFLRLYRGQMSLDSLLEKLRSRDLLDHAAAVSAEAEALVAHSPGARARPLFGRRRSHQSSPVARAYALVDRWLERVDASARPSLALLSRAACFAAGEPVPRAVLASLAGSDERLERLVELGVIEAHGDELLRVHRLLAELCRAARHDPGAQAEAEEQLAAWARTVNEGGTLEQQLAVIPHLDVAARAALQAQRPEPAPGAPDVPVTAEDGRRSAICYELGRALWAAGDLRRARACLERALELRELLYGSQDHRTIAALSSLGSLLQAQGDLAGAQVILERALERAERTLGPEHAETAVILTTLAWTLRFQGDLSGARALLERALQVSEQTLGWDDPETVARVNGLGMLLREQGDLAGARVYWERAMEAVARTLGTEHPQTLSAINNVGLLLREQGNLEAARTYMEHALRVSEQTLGPGHPDMATALDNMGTLLQVEGDLEAALDHIQRALAIRENALGPDHPATGTSYNNLGMLLRAKGDLEGAKPFLEHALIVSQRVLGPYDPQTASSYNNLGTLLLDLGDLYSAQPHLERALAIREQGLGADHPETATSLANVGALHVAYGDLAGAKAYVERALEIREEVLGADHPMTAASLHDLGRLLRGLGDLEGARAMLERAVAIREQVLGPDHPDTLASLTDLDQLVRDLGGRTSGWPTKPLPEAEFFEEDG